MALNEHLEQVGISFESISRWNWKSLLWRAIVLPPLVIVYATICASGLRSQLPVLATPLYRLPIPFAGVLERFVETQNLDIATILSLALLTTTGYLLCCVLRVYLYGEDPVQRPGVDDQRFEQLTLIMAGIITICDVSIFYAGLSQKADTLWEETNALVPALATILYLTMIVFVALMTVLLESEGGEVSLEGEV